MHSESLQRINSEYTLHLHAVVLAELYAGAGTPAFVKELQRLEKTFATKNRIVVPQKRDYVRAGQTLRKMREAHLIGGSKSSVFLADALLASSAHHEGMTLVTEDRDFEKIKSLQHFPLLLITPALH